MQKSVFIFALLFTYLFADTGDDQAAPYQQIQNETVISLDVADVKDDKAPPYERVQDECSLKVVSPDLADVKTAKIRLANGLEAYLVSDAKVPTSSAALSIDAGSWQDPEEYPGMAHFLEHMLFMGTKPYPQQEEYARYVHEHGGDTNAYTATDRTVYAFSINHDYLAGAIDRFSHFFIDPLFLSTSVGGELHIIDQEHAKNIEHDGWRAYMILKETGNSTHPHARFSTGNKATLAGIPQSALQHWYETHYSAERMHLVVISPLPLEELISMTVKNFSPVVNRHLASPVFPAEIFSDKQRGYFLYIKPVKDLKTLSLIWQLPRAIAEDQESHAASLVSYVLSNGSQNGLLETLKHQRLINTLSVGIDRFSKECAVMEIEFSLTELGIKQLNYIIGLSFEVIAKLKETGIPHFIFEEQQKIATLEYEHKSRDNAFSTAMQIAGELSQEKLATYPQKTVVPTHDNPAQIQTLLSALTPESGIYLVMADSKWTGVIPDTQEKWMNASYALREIPAEKLLSWSGASPHRVITLPASNPYIPSNLKLVQNGEPSPAMPTTISQDDSGHIYFLQDQKYLVPKTAAIFALKTAAMDGSALSRVLFDLYIEALKDKLRPDIFFASELGLDLSFYQDDDFIVSVYGYSEKAPLLLRTAFSSLHEVSPSLEQFEIYKQSLLSSYDNASKELPLRQSVQLLNSILYNNRPTAEAKYLALQGISHEQFLSFAHEVFQSTYTEGIIHGNLTSIDAKALWHECQTALHSSPLPPANRHKQGVFIPANSEGPYMICENTPRQGVGATLVLHESSFSMENRAVQQILSAALKDAFFETLRTKQQTGYIASAWDLELKEQLFQFLGVQSITHTSQELLPRFELFLEQFAHRMKEKIPTGRFETLKQSLITELAKPPENLPAKTTQLHHLAFERKGDFNWLQKRITAVQSLSHERFLEKASAFLSRDNHRRIAVLMEGVLPEKNRFQYRPIPRDKIQESGSIPPQK